MKHTIFFLHLSGQKIIDNEFCSLYTDCGGDKNEYIGRTTQLCAETKGIYPGSLAQTIGVSRGVIFNLEKNKTEPQAIVINAVCQILNINKEWLTDGTGDMESGNQAFQSAKLLEELYDIAKELSEDEQLFLLDTVKALKLRLGKRQ